MGLVTFPHEAYTVSLLEVVSLEPVCELLPSLGQKFQTARNFLLVAFFIWIQIPVKHASEVEDASRTL